MSGLAFLEGIATGASLIIAIGAQNAFVLRQGLLKNHVLPIVLICSIIDIVLIIIGISGLGLLVTDNAVLLQYVKWGSVAFLCYYGLKSLISAYTTGSLQLRMARRLSLKAAVLSTLTVTLLNPHMYLDTVVLIGGIGAQFSPLARPFFASGALSEHSYLTTISPERAPDEPTTIEIEFNKGDPAAIDGVGMSPATLLARLNKLGGINGVGRLDLVENRYVGMKSRGVYETPGGTILLTAHRAMESITLDKGSAHLKDELMPRYAELIYNGYWWSPERLMLQAAIDLSQQNVSGTVRLKLYKGSVIIEGRKSANSLYLPQYATFEEDSVYDQHDSKGFIKLNALRLRIVSKYMKY